MKLKTLDRLSCEAVGHPDIDWWATSEAVGHADIGWWIMRYKKTKRR